MKKADLPCIIIIGDNNKVSLSGKNSFPTLAILIALCAIAFIVLAISLCCPELLADFIRWMIGQVVGN